MTPAAPTQTPTATLVPTGVDADLAMGRPAADELVWRPGRNDDDVPRPRLDRALTDGEEHIPVLDDERLLVTDADAASPQCPACCG